jgi:hypothetical protein
VKEEKRPEGKAEKLGKNSPRLHLLLDAGGAAIVVFALAHEKG